METDLASLRFHERLAALVRRRGWTQKQLRIALNKLGDPVSGSTVYRWVSGKAQPTLTSTILLAHVLEVGIEELITGRPAGSSVEKHEAPVLSEEELNILWLARTIGFDQAVARMVCQPSNR